MKGKNKVMKTKIKSLNDVYKKIIACLILVIMFTVYVLPLQSVFAEEKEEASVKYSGEYFELGIRSLPSIEKMLAEFRWEEFKKSPFSRKDSPNEIEYYFFPEADDSINKALSGSYNVTSPIKLPTLFITWISQKRNTKN